MRQLLSICATVTLLLCHCHNPAMRLLRSCYATATLLLCSCYATATLLLCDCYAPAMRLLPSCYATVTLLLCACYGPAMRLLFCLEKDVDRSGQIWTSEDNGGQKWTEVDNVLFGRFIFDPSKAQALPAYQPTCPPKLAKAGLSTEASIGGARKGWRSGNGRPCETTPASAPEQVRGQGTGVKTKKSYEY